MNSKTLLLLGVVGAVAVTSAEAQVYSVNAVGYVNLSVPAGFSMIANPLDASDNTIGALLPNFPLFGNLYKWSGTSFEIATMTPAGWDKPAITLNPGEGCFIQPGAATTLTFVGEVMQGNLSNPIPAGFSIRASMVPQTAGVDVLGLNGAISNFDNLYKWNGTGYDVYTYAFNAWNKSGVPETPVIQVGESVFLNVAAAGNWTRNFSVN